MRATRTAVVLLMALVQGAVRGDDKPAIDPETAAELLAGDALAKEPGRFLGLAGRLLRWDVPADPVRVVGPVHFVGTKGLGCYLITGSAGHVFLNTGMPGSGPMIEASVRKLGFDPKDVKLLLCTHAHVDHVGGHAHMKKVTGAKVAVLREEKELLESGGKADFQYGSVGEFRFDPVTADTVFKDGDEIKLGDITLTARRTAGHTQGSATYTMTATDGGKKYTVVFPDGTGVNPGYRVAKDPSYPGIGEDYRRTFRTLEELTPDVWLAPHTHVFDFDGKLKRAATKGVKAWVDPGGYRAWIAAQKARFEARAKARAGDR